MKRIFITFLALVCIGFCNLLQAENYTGTLIVKVNNSEVVNQQSTISVTQNGNAVSLNISSFSFASIPVPMNITLNCVCESESLKKPASLTVAPALATIVLGQLELKELVGMLNATHCTLDMSIYSSKLNQNIQILFN